MTSGVTDWPFLYISQDQEFVPKSQDGQKIHIDYVRLSSDEDEEFSRELPNIIKDDLYARKVSLPPNQLKDRAFLHKSEQMEGQAQKIMRTRTPSRHWYNEFQGFRFVFCFLAVYVDYELWVGPA